MYCPSAAAIEGFGPRGFGEDASPLPERTKICLPSPLKAAAVGYQPVGRKPATRLSLSGPTDATATVLLSALATSSVPPSGESATLLGVEPGGEEGWSAIEICSFGAFDSRSTTQTAFVLAQATKSLLPSRDRAMALGCSPTAISAFGSRLSASKTRTFAPPQSET